MIIDAQNAILGRVAAYAAKQALLGETVDVVNVEKAVVSGGKRHTLSEAKRHKNMGVPRKGPYHSRLPDRYVRRVIRGMLPYKTPRGREAFSNVKCHVGIPEAFAKEKPVTAPGADASKLPNLKQITIAQICAELGHNE